MSNFSWSAPIVPGMTLAGIKLGSDLEDFKALIKVYCVDFVSGLYKFPEAPLFLLAVNEQQDRIYFKFTVADVALTGWYSQFPESKLVSSETRALVVGFLDEKVSSVSVWMFDYFDVLGDKKLTYSYQGCLADGTRLGSRMDVAASFYDLVYDEAEEWFYEKSGGVILGGGGGGLEDFEDQEVAMIMVIQTVKKR